jgi:hypothetical protein
MTTKSISVEPQVLALCSVKAALASALTRQEIADLMSWCDCQEEALWDDMTLQEILNVYRVSAEWDTWQGWAEEDRKAAHAAWNRAVVDPGNRMMPRAA